jgi:hypothetical protein
MAVTSAISDFFASIYELISSIFGAAYSIVHSVFLAAYNFVTGIFSLVGDVLGGFVDISTGVGKFIVGMLAKLVSLCIANEVKVTLWFCQSVPSSPSYTYATQLRGRSWRRRRPAEVREGELLEDCSYNDYYHLSMTETIDGSMMLYLSTQTNTLMLFDFATSFLTCAMYPA